MKYFDIIILGGGASGCMCAITSANKGQQVAIIDAGSKPAKKILATGNGRCNLTNTNMSSSFFNTNIDEYLTRFGQKDTIAFFKTLGLETYADEEGRVYPLSNSAKSVTEVISLALNETGVNFFGDTTICSLRNESDKFIIETSLETFCCKKLVVCMGGNGINLVKNMLNISVSTPRPSLVALKTVPTRSLAGTKISNCKATLYFKNKTFSQFGEILFKESGISGIAIFNLSAMLAREDEFKGKIVIDIFPQFTLQEIKIMLMTRKRLARGVDKIFEGLLASPVGYEILNRAKLDERKPVSLLTDNEINTLAYLIKNLDFDIKGYYDNNQVYSGGVSLKNLTKNLESKNIPNLFFAGEIVDVDGICGGYNLQWAWTSGHVVGESL